MNATPPLSCFLLSAALLLLPVPLPAATGELFSLSHLQSGDALRILFYPDTNNSINGDYLIDPQGNIMLPFVGRASIRNRSDADFINFLNKSFVDHLRYPNAHVEPLIRISFLGGFLHPGLYYANPTVSLFDAMRQAGGPLREDGFSVMQWERGGQILKKDLTPFLESGQSLHGIGLKSGDQITATTTPKKYFWDAFNQDALPLLTFMVTSVTTAIAVYSTYRLLSQD